MKLLAGLILGLALSLPIQVFAFPADPNYLGGNNAQIRTVYEYADSTGQILKVEAYELTLVYTYRTFGSALEAARLLTSVAWGGDTNVVKVVPK